MGPITCVPQLVSPKVSLERRRKVFAPKAAVVQGLLRGPRVFPEGWKSRGARSGVKGLSAVLSQTRPMGRAIITDQAW